MITILSFKILLVKLIWSWKIFSIKTITINHKTGKHLFSVITICIKQSLKNYENSNKKIFFTPVIEMKIIWECWQRERWCTWQVRNVTNVGLINQRDHWREGREGEDETAHLAFQIEPVLPLHPWVDTASLSLTTHHNNHWCLFYSNILIFSDKIIYRFKKFNTYLDKM